VCVVCGNVVCVVVQVRVFNVKKQKARQNLLE